MKLFWLSWALVVISISTKAVNGFINQFGTRNNRLRLLQSVSEEVLSDVEEEILFGPEFEASSASHQRHVSKMGNLLEPSNFNPLDHSSNPVMNVLRKTRETVTSCPALWKEVSMICGDELALVDESNSLKLSFTEMHNAVQNCASYFAKVGIRKGDNVAILADNSAYWLIADHGIQLAGGVSVVRGADSPVEELQYVYDNSDAKNIAVLQGPKLLKKLIQKGKLVLESSQYGPVQTIILLNKEKISDEELNKYERDLHISIQVLADLISSTDKRGIEFPSVGLNDLSTIVYTSGTTGKPKGVMLSHGNLLHQISHRLAPSKPYDDTEPLIGEKMLSLLPVWHITERSFELWIISRGCTIVYSSIRTFKNDLAKHKPEWLVLVPRVLEKVASGVQGKFNSGSIVVRTLVKFFTAVGATKAKHYKISKGLVVSSQKIPKMKKICSKAIVTALEPFDAVGHKLVWSKVQNGFGGNLKTIISGGSALSGSLEKFYEQCGIDIAVGYGLTECSPLVAHRRIDSNLIVAGCVGQPTLDTELRVVDPSLSPLQPRPALPHGEIGLVLARGPQVMKGYYKNPKATSEAIDKFQWFNTGDLGKINPITRDLILTGREKDTIVLSNGENVEPIPIEDAILDSTNTIDQIILKGQDEKFLTAVVVLNPVELALQGFLDKTLSTQVEHQQQILQDPQLTDNTSDSFIEASTFLNKCTQDLRSNTSLTKFLQQNVNQATTRFRPWEQVKQIIITLEPFAMSNGLLTQSYKIKRNSVMEQYQ